MNSIVINIYKIYLYNYLEKCSKKIRFEKKMILFKEYNNCPERWDCNSL